jgi:hypothetical protein
MEKCFREPIWNWIRRNEGGWKVEYRIQNTEYRIQESGVRSQNLAGSQEAIPKRELFLKGPDMQVQ